MLYIVLAIVLNLLKAVFRFPVLKQLNGLAGGAFGFLRGLLVCLVLFTLVPLVQTVIPLDMVNDLATLDEMLTFVRPEKNPARPEAEQGAHDDTIMALAIAYYARTQQSCTEDKPKGKRAKWTDDMYEDYYNADKSGKEYLLSKWGNPF